MRIVLLMVILVSRHYFLFSQIQQFGNKPIIDTGMLSSWPSILPYDDRVVLSADGHYVAHIVSNFPVGRATLTVQDLRGDWKKSTIVEKDCSLLFFSADSRKLCWQEGDSVWLQHAGSEKNRFLGLSPNINYQKKAPVAWVAVSGQENINVRLVNLINDRERTYTGIKKHEWTPDGSKILFTTAEGSIRWVNLLTGKESVFEEVAEYAVSTKGESVIFMTEKADSRSLQWMDDKSGGPVTIWKGQKGEVPGGYVYDKTGEQMAFKVQCVEGKQSIWYYKQGMPTAELKADDNSTGFDGDLPISGINSFSGNGRWVFFTVRKQLIPPAPEKAVTAVDIWSYRDEIINPAETRGVKTYHDFAAVLDVTAKNIQLLEEHEDERSSPAQGNVVLLKKGVSEVHEPARGRHWWAHSEPESIWLVSLEDGKRKLIIKGQADDYSIAVTWSPHGRWLYYWDVAFKHYIVVDPQTGRTFNLTANLPFSLESESGQNLTPMPVGVAGWYPGDSLVLIYDNYDIWQLDPSGKRAPVNITGGYGRHHGTTLRLVKKHQPTFQPDEEVLLWGLNDQTKHNGFFRIRLNKSGVPELLTMGPYCYMIPDYIFSFSGGMAPLECGEGKNKRWIVMRESATEFPNLFVSKDLKQFTALTNFQPQKEFNWLTAEPMSWRMYNGQQSTGVLYKPENFDATKKYPVIFNYYEKLSHRCYQFPWPGLTRSNINIPWFVSRGYLIFTPDIHYTIANTPGGMTTTEAAYNAVASAAEFLSQRPYVDKDGMAIQGHSFGGQETNGIITQTGLFAAAAEASGFSEDISMYLSLRTHDESRINAIGRYDRVDYFRQRMGATPWERPDLFCRNSAVLNANKITTPLLIFHNRKDGQVNFQQGEAMYMAMRRLGKPCWLLQYDNSGHGLRTQGDRLDYTIRLTQYFDHYLKGAPAPKWMTGNTFAPYKGRNNLYSLDSAGNCMKDCKVCAEWNAKEKITAK